MTMTSRLAMARVGLILGWQGLGLARARVKILLFDYPEMLSLLRHAFISFVWSGFESFFVFLSVGNFLFFSSY